jgi:hypothetical protein
MRTCVNLTLCTLLALALAACGDDKPADTKKDMSQGVDMTPDLAIDMEQPDAGPDQADQAEEVALEAIFDPAAYAPDNFFALPMPSDARKKPDGSLGFTDWQRAYNNNLLKLWLEASDELVRGWGLVSGVFVTFTLPVDASTLPQSVADSMKEGAEHASVMLVDVDPGSPEVGRIFPLECQLRTEAGTLSPANMLACKSPFGVLRRANTRYAFVVTSKVKGIDGAPVAANATTRALLAGQDVPGIEGQMIQGADYKAAAEVIAMKGPAVGDIALMALFTTWDPTARLLKINEFYEALPEPDLDRSKEIKLVEEYDDYVVLEAYYTVPIVQNGALPYNNAPSGKAAFGADGKLQKVADQSIRVYLTIPKRAQPEAGWPVMMYLHGSGGVARELIERGPMPTVDDPAPPGSGPAGVVARYGVAGFAADFQLHGMRFDPPDTTGLKLYNLIGNPRATIDNFLVAANEVTLHARLLRGIVIDPAEILPAGSAAKFDVSADPDGMIRFNDDRFSAMGQSMGSTIGAPAMTIDKVTDAMVFSGSGGVLVEIAVTSKKPIDVGAVLRNFLRYKPGEELDQFDPALHTIQHIWDMVDGVVHARHVARDMHPGIPPKHVLQHSGLQDSYFTTISRAAFSTALGSDLVTPVLEQAAFLQMSLEGKTAPVDAPVSGNGPRGSTNVTVQYAPEVLDGHNVAYQVAGAQAQYGCFVATFDAATKATLRSVANSAVSVCLPPTR